MFIRRKLTIRIKHLFALALVVGLIIFLAWLSSQHRYQWDWTVGARNSLSPASSMLLERLDGPIAISVYASKKANLRYRIQQLLARYQHKKSDIQVRFVDPATVPDELNRLGITTDGELRIEYKGRAEHVLKHTEQAVTNALNRVARSGERWIVFVSGHGERDLLGEANHDLGTFGNSLAQRGYQIQPITLTEVYEIPANTALLIIAGPKVPLLDDEIRMLEAFLDAHGNLLWLADSGDAGRLIRLADKLELALGSGLIVDPTTPLFGGNMPTFPVVAHYPAHPITAGFDLITLFPEAIAVNFQSNGKWRATPIVTTGEEAWLETTQPYEHAVFEAPHDHPGPITLGVAIEPHQQDGGVVQRIVVMGDGDF